MADSTPVSTEGTGGTSRLLRGGALVGGLGLAASYLLAWVELAGPTRPRGEGPDRVRIGSEALLRQQGFQNNAGEVLTGADIAFVPVAVAVLGVLAALVALASWRLSTQALVGFFGFVGGALAVYFWTFLSGDATEFIQVGNHEGPATSFDPAVALWLVMLSGFVVVACGGGAAIRSLLADDRRSEE